MVMVGGFNMSDCAAEVKVVIRSSSFNVRETQDAMVTLTGNKQ